MDLKVAVVTGANKGIGFEVARQLARNGILVIVTSRDEGKGQAAVDQLKTEGFVTYYHQLDVSSDESVETFAQHMQEGIGKVDILINNAGIFPEQGGPLSLFDVELDIIRKAFETNTLGSLRLIRALVPFMSPDGKIVNVSSGMGQLSDMDSGYPAYRLSKVALNAVTKIASSELQENTNITVNAVCPGWVKTDMGGIKAPKSVEEGADTIVWLALGADGTDPTGKFFRDRNVIEW